MVVIFIYESKSIHQTESIGNCLWQLHRPLYVKSSNKFVFDVSRSQVRKLPSFGLYLR